MVKVIKNRQKVSNLVFGQTAKMKEIIKIYDIYKSEKYKRKKGGKKKNYIIYK